MASGSNSAVLTNPNGGKYNLLISWNENSTSIENNTSNITVTAKLTKNNSRFEVNNAGVLKAYWHDDKTNSDTEFASLAVTELGYNSTERVASGTKNMTHKDDGTLNGYAYASWTRNNSYGGYVPTSGTCRAPSSGTTALTTIARKATIKSAPNFNDEDNPTITYENKAGNSVSSLQACISLAGSTDDIVYRDISKTGTSYTFNLTTEERNVLRNATTTSNSRTVKFFVRTIIGSNTFYDIADKTFSIVNANPTFTNYTFHDGNSTTTAITGNNQWIIQNKSSLVVDITSANKAVANKGASMSSYVYEISSYSGSANYTTSNLSKTIGTINANQNQNLKVTAKDSRGNSTAVSKTVNIVPYATPVLNVSATRQNNFEANTTIKVSGSASLMKVNNVVKNAVNATNGVQYRKKASSTSTWGSWVNISSSYNTSTGAVTVSDFIISLDNQQAWDLQFKLTDKLETKTVSITVSQGQPQFFIGDDGRVSVGGMPSLSKPAGNLGQLEIYGMATRDATGKWIKGRDNAVAFNRGTSSFAPTIACGAKNGVWTVGGYPTSDDKLYFTYTTDTDYANGTNNALNYVIDTDGTTNLKVGRDTIMIGDTLVAAMCVTTLDWNGTSFTRWSNGSWYQYGKMISSESDKSILKLNNTSDKTWYVLCSFVCPTVTTPSNSYLETSIVFLDNLTNKIPTTRLCNAIFSCNSGATNLWGSIAGQRVFTVEPHSTRLVTLAVRTSGNSRCQWRGGNTTTNMTGDTNFGGISAMLTAQLIDIR